MTQTVPFSASETLAFTAANGSHEAVHEAHLADFDIPVLDPFEYDDEAGPIRFEKWARKGRNEQLDGIHFFTADYKFATVLRDPALVGATNPRLVIEPDTSSAEDDQFPVALAQLWRRRTFCALLQAQYGTAIAVNLNCVGWLRDLIFTGVPTDYPYFATRYQRTDLSGEPVGIDGVIEDHELVREHVGPDGAFQFFVYSGGRAVQQLCQERGWIHIPSPTQISQQKEA